jgi:microcystin-dependent protein
MQGLSDIVKAIDKLNYRDIPNLVNIVNNMSLQIGEYKMSAQPSDINGWLICDGRSISRQDYKHLYDVIGSAFGSLDADTFLLPDFRGRVMGCIGAGAGLINRALGTKVGTETHVLALNEIPGHTHTGETVANGMHNHGAATGIAGGHSHTTNATGGGLGLATADGTNTVVDVDNSGGELNVWTSPRALAIDVNGEHTHAINNDGNHTHMFTTNSVGGGLAHNNMQPTLFGGNMMIFSGLVKIF